MTTPYGSYGASNSPATPTSFAQIQPPAQPSTRGRGGAVGAKRGRKPRGALAAGASSPRPFVTSTFSANASGSGAGSSSTGASGSFNAASPSAQYPRVHWAMPGDGEGSSTTVAGNSTSVDAPADASSAGRAGTPRLDGINTLNLQGIGQSQLPLGTRPPGYEEDGEGDDELLPAMADDDYSAQLSFQSQSKDNLKVLMDNFSPSQYDRFEAYRRHALPKQAVRKVIQQTCGQQVSQPVAQIIAGFSKVFVGEMVEKARAVQRRRGETGPLSPDHLREAYRAYQQETGHVGAARPLRSKKLFVR